jgi:hypothetical protein
MRDEREREKEIEQMKKGFELRAEKSVEIDIGGACATGKLNRDIQL